MCKIYAEASKEGLIKIYKKTLKKLLTFLNVWWYYIKAVVNDDNDKMFFKKVVDIKLLKMLY